MKQFKVIIKMNGGCYEQVFDSIATAWATVKSFPLPYVTYQIITETV